jgi:hypothetical protein
MIVLLIGAVILEWILWNARWRVMTCDGGQGVLGTGGRVVEICNFRVSALLTYDRIGPNRIRKLQATLRESKTLLHF